MDGVGKTIITVIMAIIGIAILAVVVSKKSNTSNVITSGADAFSNILKTALSPIM